MSLKNKFISILGLTVGIAALSVVGFAQDNQATPKADKAEKHMKRGHDGERKFGHGMRGGGMMRGLHGITLTDTQKEQIRVIRESNKPDAALMQEIKAIHEAKRSGTALTVEQTERMKAIREQMKANHKLVREQVMAILTPEQKAQIEAKKAERKLRREEFRKQRELRRNQAPATDAKTIEG